LTALLILSGCARGTDELFPEPEPVLQHVISWNINSPQEGNTRALVNNDVMRDACTPVAGDANETVGVWGDYDVESNGQNVTVNEFVATPLTFNPDKFNWVYPGELRYWESQAVYDFRACYPQELMTNLMTQMEATILQGGPINTSVLQEDILVAATQVDTRVANLAEPVYLNMQHVFAAIKFKVKAVDGFTPAAGEGVTSCWLQNMNNATNLFSPSGYLVHSGNVSPEITWHPYESSAAPMYVWEHQGVDFYYENTLYTPNGGLKGEEYTHNDGWLLVVPQEVKPGTLQFCYTLKNAGNQVFTVNIPAITYKYGKKYTYMLEIRGSEVEVKLTIASWNRLNSSEDITI
jgi:hypothetical protein